ncbi:DUF1772 domain-containing protein [Streptomonospora arabica]|uniref:DUF1772 domain-containing protein n=1 Tax=Streptomonospora arabica TaxID=412417 RepID=A0ABV9SDM5_9ACTN
MRVTLMALASLSSGLAAGALLVGAVVILPLLLSQPVERYPAVNTFVLRRMDKMMPVCVGLAVLSGAVLAFAIQDPAGRAMYAVGALLLAGVVAVSIGRIGPINDAIGRMDTEAPRPDWRELRARWRNWHIVRVSCGQAGALLYTAALAAVLVTA